MAAQDQFVAFLAAHPEVASEFEGFMGSNQARATLSQPERVRLTAGAYTGPLLSST